ncbi:MAG TPA: YbdK family carboxylate-amine ligase [Burkholderiales bacterium]|nr:YbdK family carboxylate-amine ligase [Burkholderiales bacterium]
MLLGFGPSKSLSLGIELELQLVRAHDRDLAHEAGDLIERLARKKVPGAVKPEVTLSMIELNSTIQDSWAGALEELQVQRAAVSEAAGVLNLGVCGGGTHPFHDWSERRVTPAERFVAVTQRYGYLAKQFTVFGQHIHLGCRSGDEAVALTHLLTRYVPHFIALSAASPFYQGEDTSFQSSRLTAVSAFPLSGHMPFVPDWAAFEEYFEAMRGYGIVEAMKDFYWDIRPKPEYGTIEIRVCDTPLTVRRAALLAGYAQALAAWLLEEVRQAPSAAVYQVNAFNRFEACRFGFQGELVDPHARRRRRIGEDILDTVAALMPQAERLGATEAVRELADGVRRGYSDAGWLREKLVSGGSLADVVRESAARWSAPGAPPHL